MLEQYQELARSKEFQDWKKENKDFFLAHIMIINEGATQIGFSDKKGEKITTFILDSNTVRCEQSEEIFKEPNSKIIGLDINKVKVTVKEALAHGEAVQKERYTKHDISKKIVILQNLPIGQVYNITFVTDTFHTLNVKVDAATGELIEERLSSLFDMVREYKGKDEGKTGDKTDYIG